MLFPLLLLCFHYGSNAQDFSDQKELLAVTVMFRHGDCTPISSYPNDPYKDKGIWPVGPGQLTPRGKRMQFHLGQYLRRRYGSKILREEYNETDIYVRSTDVDRTLMSALSNLAGLYPPKGNQIWNPNLLWQPVPVHTRPLEYDNLLSSHAECPRFKQLYEEVMKSKEIQALNEKFQWLYEYISNHTGAIIDNPVEVDYVFDALLIEQIYNLTLPKWTKKVFPEPMKFLRDLSFQLTTWTHELKRLKSGPLVQDILDRAKNIVRKTNSSNSVEEKNEPKMTMYSAHDTTLASFLNALGMYEPSKPPPYASMVIVEVFRDTNTQKHEVRFLFRNRTAPAQLPNGEHVDHTNDDNETKPFVKHLLGKCDEFCSIEDFEQLTSHLRLSQQNWKEECNLVTDPVIKIVTISSITVMAILSILILVVVICACCKRMKQDVHEYNYLSVNQDEHDRVIKSLYP